MNLKKILNQTSVFLLIVSTVFFLYCGSKLKITKDMNIYEKFHICEQLYEEQKYTKAIEELTKIRYQLIGTKYVDKAIFLLAESYRHSNDYIEALVNYQSITRDYPNSQYLIAAQYYIAICYEKMSLKAQLDQEYTNKAITAFKDLKELYPDNIYQDSIDFYMNKLNNKLAEKEFRNGLLYYRLGNDKSLKAAELYFQDMILNYYNSDWIDDSFYYLALTYIKMNNSGKGILFLQRLINEFEDSKYIKKAKKELKKINEKK